MRRIVLLPGLDGTGALFDDFVRTAPATVRCDVVSLPQEPLGYAELVEGTLALRGALLPLAERYRDAVFAAHKHTQPAQPSTVAHYLLAVIEQLERDTVRLKAAFASTNQNPLGACAITGTGQSSAS